MKCRQKLYSIITCCVISINCLNLQAAVVLAGDPDAAPGTTFSFPVLPHATSSSSDMFIVAASGGAPKHFALCATNRANNKFDSFAPEQARVNNQDGQPNPLYNANFSYLTLLSGQEGSGLSSFRGEWPALVKKDAPNNVYILDFFFATAPNVLSAENIKDSSGNLVANGIVGLGNVSNVFVAAAVLGHGQANLGIGGSGIAFLLLNSIKVEENEKTTTTRELHQIDAVVAPPPANPTDTRALPLTFASSAVAIANPLQEIQNQVKFFWDEKLKVLFCAVQITGGANPADGGKAIFRVLAIEGNKFTLFPIAPDTVFTDNTTIVGGRGANLQVSMNFVKTMVTSTRLNYLIVQGGIGDPVTVQNTVYALPLVNNPNPVAQQGTIANKLENPATLSLKFGFQTPATTPEEMTTIDDVAAQVGGGAIPNGSIVDMFVKNDCVFVSVLNPDVNEKPGLFYSQALFDSTTKISSWTVWQRVNGSIDPVLGASYDSIGNFTYMTGNTVDTIQTVKRTVWGLDSSDGLLGGTVDDASVGFISAFLGKFPYKIGGIQGLFDFPINTPTLNGISLVVATGNNIVTLAATGDSSTGNYCPNFGNYAQDQFEFDNGTVTQTLPNGLHPRLLTITGGDLAKIGSITKAEIASDGLQPAFGYLFVGGTAGLAVLTNPEGGSWTGLATYFAGITSGMAFKKIGNYSFVRKLFADSGFLYVMTDKQLDRINLAASDLENGVLSVVTLASNTASVSGLDKNDTFTDFIVSGKFAVLATSKGLYRVGNGSNITTADGFASIGWTKLILPETVGPVIQLQPITQSGRAQDLATNGGGNLYVLNAYVGKNLGQIYRFTVKDVSDAPVDSTTIQLFPDFFMAGIPAPLFDFNGFRDLIYTDGAATLNAENRDLLLNPFVNIMFGMQTGVGSLTNQPVPLALFNASIIQRLMRSSASGAWMIGGDFGIQVSE